MIDHACKERNASFDSKCDRDIDKVQIGRAHV